jgi:hypothetical protein
MYAGELIHRLNYQMNQGSPCNVKLEAPEMCVSNATDRGIGRVSVMRGP